MAKKEIVPFEAYEKFMKVLTEPGALLGVIGLQINDRCPEESGYRTRLTDPLLALIIHNRLS